MSKREFALVLGLTVLVAFTMLMISACGPPAPKHESVRGDQGSISSRTVTEGAVIVGNFTYIPINRDGLPQGNMEETGAAIATWEKANPDRCVVDVDYHWVQYAGDPFTADYTYGITIYSRTADSPCACR